MKKLIDLPQSVIDDLAIQAIQSGHRHFKPYAEKLLTVLSRHKGQLIENDELNVKLKDLQK